MTMVGWMLLALVAVIPARRLAVASGLVEVEGRGRKLTIGSSTSLAVIGSFGALWFIGAGGFGGGGGGMRPKVVVSGGGGEVASLDFSNLDTYAATLATVDTQTYAASDTASTGWSQFAGNIDGSNTTSPAMSIITSEATPTGDSLFGRFYLEGLEDGWTARHHIRSFSGADSLAFGCVMRWSYPSATTSDQSWGKGIGFRTDATNSWWAGYQPPGGPPPRTEEEAGQITPYGFTAGGTSYSTNRNADTVSPVDNGTWFVLEVFSSPATNELKAWWNGTQHIDTTHTSSSGHIEVKIPMITLGGGSGIGPLTANDYIDVDACVVYYN